MKKLFDFQFIRSDLLGGLTAGIVALPLALAFGEQSGLGASAGLYGAAFIAFFASLFGGTPTQISGPTAPMTALSLVVVAGILQVFEGRLQDALPVILMVFFLAGLFQLVLGMLRLGSFIRFIPYTVVSGFMTGIGVIILITQVLPAIGYYSGEDQAVIESFKPHAEELILDRILKEEAIDGILVLEEFRETASRAELITNADILKEAKLLAANDSKSVLGSLKYFANGFTNINWVEFLLAALTILIIYGFKRITSAIPSTLVALFLVSGAAMLLELDYVKIREIPTGLPNIHLDMFTGFDIGAISPYIVTAMLLALLGAIDSLLTSVVADNLTRTQHDPNRELVGQGIGNGIASLFGGIPGAGATIRTVVNIQAGGKTRLSGMFAGVLLFAIVIFLGPIASKIPAAVLAGILIVVGFGVMDYKGLRALPKMTLSEKLILITVLLLTVFWQLVYAVAVGLVMASLVFLKRMSDISADQSTITDLDASHANEPLWEDESLIPPEIREKVFIKHLEGPLFFGFVSHFRALVSELPDIHLLVIRMEKVPFIDQSGIYALVAAIEDLYKLDVIVAITGANAQADSVMRKNRMIPDLVPEAHVFKTLEDCLLWMQAVLENEDLLKTELNALKKRR